MSTLSHILTQAIEFTASDAGGGIDFDEMLQLLDVGPFRENTGTRNEHLANPLNRDPNVCYARPRATPLTGDEPVFGDFLILDYCGHYPTANLCDYDNEQALESAILGPAGLTNPFTTCMLAFKYFTLVNYSLSFTTIDGKRVGFEKHRQYEPPVYPDSENFQDLQLRWIG